MWAQLDAELLLQRRDRHQVLGHPARRDQVGLGRDRDQRRLPSAGRRSRRPDSVSPGPIFWFGRQADADHVDLGPGGPDQVVEPLAEQRPRLVQAGGVDQHQLGVGAVHDAADGVPGGLRLATRRWRPSARPGRWSASTCRRWAGRRSRRSRIGTASACPSDAGSRVTVRPRSDRGRRRRASTTQTATPVPADLRPRPGRRRSGRAPASGDRLQPGRAGRDGHRHRHCDRRQGRGTPASTLVAAYVRPSRSRTQAPCAAPVARQRGPGQGDDLAILRIVGVRTRLIDSLTTRFRPPCVRARSRRSGRIVATRLDASASRRRLGTAPCRSGARSGGRLSSGSSASSSARRPGWRARCRSGSGDRWGARPRARVPSYLTTEPAIGTLLSCLAIRPPTVSTSSSSSSSAEQVAELVQRQAATTPGSGPRRAG